MVKENADDEGAVEDVDGQSCWVWRRWLASPLSVSKLLAVGGWIDSRDKAWTMQQMKG